MSDEVRPFKFNIGDWLHTITGYYGRGKVVGRSRVSVGDRVLNAYELEYTGEKVYPRADMADWLDSCLKDQRHKLDVAEYEKAVARFNHTYKGRISALESVLGRI